MNIQRTEHEWVPAVWNSANQRWQGGEVELVAIHCKGIVEIYGGRDQCTTLSALRDSLCDFAYEKINYDGLVDPHLFEFKAVCKATGKPIFTYTPEENFDLD